tara:strand:+ start:292 stop:927 length:636 start_codon:yes stop_codon:yes gene_type:complete
MTFLFNKDQKTTYNIKIAAIIIPGKIPAINNFAIDSCTVTPYIIKIIEGGINKPRVPDPAKLPSKILSGYLLFLNSGMDIFPTVATVAAEEPDIAANKAQPTTLTCISPPGSFCIHGDRPSKRFFESLVLNNISPIQTNNGKAVRVHDEEVPQIVVAIASPTGLEVNNIIPIAETLIMLIATQTPVPRKNNKILIKKIVRNISGIFFIKYF